MHFDPPNDHKDYLHRSGRTARAGADGLVVALVERGQVREVERMHVSAGISSARHHVAAGHEVVREIATSGTPVPPPPPAAPAMRLPPARQPPAAAAGDAVRRWPGSRGPLAGHPVLGRTSRHGPAAGDGRCRAVGPPGPARPAPGRGRPARLGQHPAGSLRQPPGRVSDTGAAGH